MLRTKFFLNSLALFTWGFFHCLLSHSQDLEALSSKLNVIQQNQNAAEENVLLVKSFDEWQEEYEWRHGASRTIKEYGFATYTKFTTEGKRYGVIRLPEDTITKAVYDEIWSASSGGVIVVNNDKEGMIDNSGKLIIPTENDHITTFNEERAFLKRNKKYALVTYSGKQLTPFQFDDIGGFSDGRCPVIVGGKMGYIDKNGAYVLKPQFNNATNFYYGFARIYSAYWESVLKGAAYEGVVKTNFDYGYTKKIPFLINKRGKKIFTGEFGDEITVSENGYALIHRNWSTMIIDTSGKVILPLSRKLSIKYMTPDWFVLWSRNADKVGAMDYKGNDLLKVSFWWIEPMRFNNNTLGKAHFEKDNFFYIDHNCKCVEFDNVKCPD